MARISNRAPTKLNLDVFKRTLRRWHWWVGVAIYICLIQSGYPTSYMSLWLKAQPRFSIPQVNNIPSAVYGLSALSSWMGTSLATVWSPWKIWTAAEFVILFDFICLEIWHIPYALKFFNWISMGVQGCISPILYTWMNLICREDAEERALVMSSMMTIGYSTQIWVPLFTFPTVEAPRWKKGWAASIAFLIGMWGLQSLGYYLGRKDERKKAATASSSEDGAFVGETLDDARDVKDKDEESL